MTTTKTKRQELIQIYSDFHKDAYGFRPRYNYHDYTLEQLENDFARFKVVCAENYKNEQLQIEFATQKFNEKIQSLIEMGAGNRKTAIRWIIDSYGVESLHYGADYFVAYELGLGHTDFSINLIIEIEPIMLEYVAKMN